MKHRTGFLLIVVLAILLTGCQNGSVAIEPTPSATATIEATATASPTPSHTATPAITATPALTSRGLLVFSGLRPEPATFVMTGDGIEKSPILINDYPFLNVGATWSPQLSWVALTFVNVQDRTFHLGFFNTNSAELHYSEAVLEGLNGPVSWSHDERYVIYSDIQTDGFERDIFRLDIETDEIANLTRNFPTWDNAPAYSPDGRYIYYTSDYAPGGKQFDDIWRMHADGTGHINLTDNGIDWEDAYPAVSPDSKSVAFLRYGIQLGDTPEGGPSGIWLMDADGSNQRLLLEAPIVFGNSSPVWSPNGEYLAASIGITGVATLYIIHLESQHVDTFSFASDLTALTWSPDSIALAFTSNTEAGPSLKIYSLESELFYEPLEGPGGFASWSPPRP